MKAKPSLKSDEFWGGFRTTRNSLPLSSSCLPCTKWSWKSLILCYFCCLAQDFFGVKGIRFPALWNATFGHLGLNPVGKLTGVGRADLCLSSPQAAYCHSWKSSMKTGRSSWTKCTKVWDNTAAMRGNPVSLPPPPWMQSNLVVTI